MNKTDRLYRYKYNNLKSNRLKMSKNKEEEEEEEKKKKKKKDDCRNGILALFENEIQIKQV